jgi:hypothetical protein
MPVEDYIRIYGDAQDPAPFQGIGGIESTSSDEETGDTASIDDGLWNAQSTYIAGESAYLTQLNNEWKDTETLIEGGTLDHILDFLGEAIEEGIGWVVFQMIKKLGIVLSGGQSVIVGVLVSIAAGFGWEKLRDAFVNWLKEGNKLLEAMIAEDTALLAAEQSLDNYRLRNDVILRHEQTIFRLLDELSKIKANSQTLIESKKDEDDAWKDVLDGLNEAIEEIDDWINNVEEADKKDLPVPAPPSLPTIPDGNKAISRKLAYLVAKYGLRFLLEQFRKSRETDEHVSDLVEAVKDLQYNNEMFDIPNSNARVHLLGKVIHYGGDT